MTDLDEIYIRLFIIVPLLLYIGHSIMKEKTHTGTFLFHMMVVFTIILAVFFHLKYIYKILKRIFHNQEYQKEFGFFVICLAFFIIFLCCHDLWITKKKNKKHN